MSEDAFGSFLVLFALFCVTIPIFVLYIYSVFWAYNDANKRGKSGCLAALLVFLVSWPIGLLIWLLIRPGEEMKPPTA